MDPRTSGSWGVNSATQDKDVNGVPWSLVSSWRMEERKELHTVCWLATGESGCNLSSCFMITLLCAKPAVNSSCLCTFLRAGIRSSHWGLSLNRSFTGLLWGCYVCWECCVCSPQWSKITNLSYFPNAYLVFVCEKDEDNCFNLKYHKGNRVFCNGEQVRRESFPMHLVSI